MLVSVLIAALIAALIAVSVAVLVAVLIAVLVAVLQEDTRKDSDMKAEHRFSEVMSDRNVAVSDFAMRRSLTQQRQYLPIYAVRTEVCARDIYNNGVGVFFLVCRHLGGGGEFN